MEKTVNFGDYLPDIRTRVPPRILCVCRECGKEFSVTEGTIFNDNAPAAGQVVHGDCPDGEREKGLSALQSKRDLNVAY